jgi:hypothetical protein
MRRPTILILTAAVAIAGGAASASAGSADDQAAADEAVASFNERMTEAGGESSGPPDTTPMEDEEIVEDDPFAACFGDEAALEPGGPQLEGESARAFSDDFVFTSSDQPDGTDPMAVASGDTVSALVVTVDADHVELIDGWVDAFGSEDTATCVEDLYGEMSASESGDDTSLELPAIEIDVTAEPDLGIGDASAGLHLMLASGGEFAFELNTAIFAARTGRSLVIVSIIGGAEPVSDVDGTAELAAIVDAL